MRDGGVLVINAGGTVVYGGLARIYRGGRMEEFIVEVEATATELPGLLGRKFGYGYAIENYRLENWMLAKDKGGPWRYRIFENTMYGVKIEGF
ncbi:hypothetical protein DL768_010683 [Monosporascus sp. mg162]|nr:hypothetical protein DL768_010683 [Monosporascus sp. mg162]